MYVYFFLAKFSPCTVLIRSCTFIYFQVFSRLYVYSLTFIFLTLLHTDFLLEICFFQVQKDLIILAFERVVGRECYFQMFLLIRTFVHLFLSVRLSSIFSNTFILACTYFLVLIFRLYVYFGLYVYFFEFKFLPVRLFPPVRLLVIRDSRATSGYAFLQASLDQATV